MFLFKRGPKHKHSWKRMSCSPYDSITGPRTVIAWWCRTCNQLESTNVKGVYHMKDFE